MPQIKPQTLLQTAQRVGVCVGVCPLLPLFSFGMTDSNYLEAEL